MQSAAKQVWDWESLDFFKKNIIDGLCLIGSMIPHVCSLESYFELFQVYSCRRKIDIIGCHKLSVQYHRCKWFDYLKR